MAQAAGALGARARGWEEKSRHVQEMELSAVPWGRVAGRGVGVREGGEMWYCMAHTYIKILLVVYLRCKF